MMSMSVWHRVRQAVHRQVATPSAEEQTNSVPRNEAATELLEDIELEEALQQATRKQGVAMAKYSSVLEDEALQSSIDEAFQPATRVEVAAAETSLEEALDRAFQ